MSFGVNETDDAGNKRKLAESSHQPHSNYLRSSFWRNIFSIQHHYLDYIHFVSSSKHLHLLYMATPKWIFMPFYFCLPCSLPSSPSTTPTGTIIQSKKTFCSNTVHLNRIPFPSPIAQKQLPARHISFNSSATKSKSTYQRVSYRKQSVQQSGMP